MDRHGHFETPEISKRAKALSELWEANWPDTDPFAWEFKNSHPDRWVRFHSLPLSKQDAESDAEYAEVERRHRIILNELLRSTDTEPLYVIAEEWGWNDYAGGWTKRLLPDAWPWKIARPETEDLPTYFWVREFLNFESMRGLLRAVADDRAWIVITDRGGEWLYIPYYGGGDAIARTSADRDRLAHTYSVWLPSREDGL